MSEFQISKKKSVSIKFNNGAPDSLLIENEDDFDKDFYLNFYSENSEDALKKTREIQFSKILSTLENLCGDQANILEVGAGNGYFIKYLRKHYKTASKITAIDPFSNSEEVEKVGIEDFSPKEKFDLIILLDVFEHFQDASALLNQLNRLLNKDGILLLKVPNKQSFLYKLSKNMRGVLPSLSRKLMMRLYQVNFFPPHYYYYDVNSLSDLCMKECGLVKVHTEYMPEIYFSTMMSRLWGVPWWAKPLLLPAAFVLVLFSHNKGGDGIIMGYQKPN